MTDFRFPPQGTPYEEGGSHIPALLAALAAAEGPVLELGCGTMSTPVIHAHCAGARRDVYTLDNDPVWFEPIAAVYRRPWHWFGLIEDWDDALTRMNLKWGVVFVDQAPAIHRAAAIRWALPRAEIVVIHDTEPHRHERPEEHPWVDAVRETLGDAQFRSDYTWGSFPSHTTLLSNRRPVDFDLPFRHGKPGT